MLLMVLAKAVIGISGRTGTGRPAPVSRFDERAAQATMITRLSRTATAIGRGSASPSWSPSSHARERHATSASSAIEIEPHTSGWRRNRVMGPAARRPRRRSWSRPTNRRAARGRARSPVTDWTVIGIDRLDAKGGARGQVDRRLDDREVGAGSGRRGQVDGRVAGVDPEARSGRPGSRARGQESDLEVDRACRGRSGSTASPPDRAPRRPSRCPRSSWVDAGHADRRRPPPRPAG